MSIIVPGPRLPGWRRRQDPTACGRLRRLGQLQNALDPRDIRCGPSLSRCQSRRIQNSLSREDTLAASSWWRHPSAACWVRSAVVFWPLTGIRVWAVRLRAPMLASWGPDQSIVGRVQLKTTKTCYRTARYRRSDDSRETCMAAL